MKLFNRSLDFGTEGKWYQNAMDPGSMLWGGAGVSNSLGMERDGNKRGMFGDRDKFIDWMGSPQMAGTNAQGYGRGAALLYGLWAGAGALGGGSAAGGGGYQMPAAQAEAPGSVAAQQGGGGLSGLGGNSGWLDYLRWGQRGYRAYNILDGMNGQPAQQQTYTGGNPYSMNGSYYSPQQGQQQRAWYYG